MSDRQTQRWIGIALMVVFCPFWLPLAVLGSPLLVIGAVVFGVVKLGKRRRARQDEQVLAAVHNGKAIRSVHIVNAPTERTRQ